MPAALNFLDQTVRATPALTPLSPALEVSVVSAPKTLSPALEVSVASAPKTLSTALEA